MRFATHWGTVVIEVMGAFTVTAWAFPLRADRIVLLRELNEALELKPQTPESLAQAAAACEPLLCSAADARR
jgi:phosphosulfolactate phosphohydrolase-like enzyme